jgi:photosystem II stability/assembly factor-like uncharacterized protein
MSRASWSAALTLLALAASAPESLGAQEPSESSVINATANPLLRSFTWRSIGPIGQGGRVDDLAVHPTDPTTFFVGFATGGLWKTTNNGTTFRPVFDTYETHSVGDIAIAPSDPEVVYVGTGEANNRQSSSIGAGMYKSTDGGETFEYVGLRETQSIARVRVHPSNPDVVWVAAAGHLFGPNPERGIFKSSDGGATWIHVLEVDEDTGATDLVLDPSDPNTLFAATYQRRRTACCFVGGGPGSGLWRSDDGGETWAGIEGNGLPRGSLGRIALAVTPADPDVVYAQIEVAADEEEPLSDEEQAEWERLDDADSLPPDPEYAGIWRSTDKGRTWEFRSNENGRPMYFSQIRVSPEDADLVYVVDQRVHKSRDGGRTFETLEGYGHVDQHALWIDPADHDHILIGNDGSVDVTWDQGETWEALRRWELGQPYHASVDMRRPYYVCTGLQDNGSWCGPSAVRSGEILSEDWYRVGGGDGFYTAVDPTDYNVVFSESQNGNIRRVNMSTGVQQSIRPRAPTDENAESTIRPVPPVGTEIRWNWNTPFMISHHNPRTILAGGNRLFISRDRGDTWTMTEDLTKDIDRDRIDVMGFRNDLPRCRQNQRGEECILSRNDGVSMWSTLTTVAESPLVPGLYWVGSDDGNIQVSQDGGATWTEVSRNLPGGTTQYYVSRVEASWQDAATAYVSIDGHKSDDARPYVYVTRDYGETWTSIASNLPEYGNVNTIRQDPKAKTVLYVGTEFGFFISGDEGENWVRFMPNLPVVRIDDVLVHPRDGDLVLATHGRSVYVMDDITPFHVLTEEMLADPVHLFTPRDAVRWKNDVRRARSVTGTKTWTGQNAPEGTAIHYYLADSTDGDVQLTIVDVLTAEVFRTLEGPGDAGLNRVQWDLRGERPEGRQGGGGFGGNRTPVAEPGVYRVTLTVDGTDYSTTVNVLEDIWLDQR